MLRSRPGFFIYSIWAVAQGVPLKPHYRLYRDCGAGLTRRDKANAAARAFVAFLEGAQGCSIFEHWSWLANSARSMREPH